MDLRSARLTEQMNDSRTGRSAHYGIVYHYDSLAANALANGIKLDFNRALTLILRGLYETPSDVFVLYKAYSVGNPALLCVTESGIRPESGTPTTISASTGLYFASILPAITLA